MIWALVTGTKAGRYIAGALVAVTLAGGGVAWLRWDAVRSDRAAQDAAENAARIDYMKGAKNVDAQIENLDRDAFDNTIDGLPRRDDARRTVQ